MKVRAPSSFRRANLKMAAHLYTLAIPVAEKFLYQEPANEDLQETLPELRLSVDSLHAAHHSLDENDVQAKNELDTLRRLAKGSPVALHT